jgi:hypothetical protein
LNGTLQSSSASISIGASGRTVTLAGNVVINTYSDAGAGATLSIAGDVQATSTGAQALTLKAKSGAISILGNIGSVASLSTLTLGDAAQTGLVTVDGTLSVQTLVAGANSGTNAFDVHLKNTADAAGTSTVSGVATFYNTGTLGLGDYQSDVFNFQGGLAANASSLTTIRASQINATNSNISVSGPVTVGHSSTVKAGSGQLSFGALSLSGGVTLSLGDSNQSGTIALSTVSGESGSGAYSNLALRTTASIAVSGAIGTRIGTLTVTNSSGTTFSGAVGTSSDLISQIVLTATTGTIEFAGNLYATSLSNPASTFDLKLYGANTKVVNTVTLNTTGTVYFGNLVTTIADCNCTSSDTPASLTFERGITHTAGNNTIAGSFVASTLSLTDCPTCGLDLGQTIRYYGVSSTLDFGAQSIALNNLILGNGVTLTLGAGRSGAISVGSVSGIDTGNSGTNLNCPANLVINTTGTFGLTRTISTNIGSVTITNSGGATFGGAVSVGTEVLLSNTTGSIVFNGALTTPTLTTASRPYNLALNGASGAITNAFTPLNTGTLRLGSSGGTLNFNGGLTASAPSQIYLAGTIAAGGAGVISLAGATSGISVTSTTT